MEIQFVKKGANHLIQMSGGWVTDKVCDYVRTALQATCWNITPVYSIGPQEDNGNLVSIVIPMGRDNDVQEFCDYLNIILRDIIPTAFTEINASPYRVPEYDDRGGLDLLYMIAKETGCPVDFTEWMKPVIFKPISNVQYEGVIALLREFKMSFHNYVTKEVFKCSC
jgi:hypothetical protein